MMWRIMILIVFRQSPIRHLVFCAGECPLCLSPPAPFFIGVAVFVFEVGAFDLSAAVESVCAMA